MPTIIQDVKQPRSAEIQKTDLEPQPANEQLSTLVKRLQSENRSLRSRLEQAEKERLNLQSEIQSLTISSAEPSLQLTKARSDIEVLKNSLERVQRALVETQFSDEKVPDQIARPDQENTTQFINPFSLGLAGLSAALLGLVLYQSRRLGRLKKGTATPAPAQRKKKNAVKRGMVFASSSMTAGGLSGLPPVMAAIIRPAYEATGRIGFAQIGKPNGKERAFGTGFLITERHIMTNRHVWEMYSDQLAGDTGAGIEFYAEKGSDKSDFVAFDGAPPVFLPGLDIAVFTLVKPLQHRQPIVFETEQEASENGNIAKDVDAKADGREVVVIGYPQIKEITDEISAVVESQPVFGVKRYSQGKIFRHSTAVGHSMSIEVPVPDSVAPQGHVEALSHNASTLGGSSGSPVIDKTTGRLIAIHFGFDMAFNWAEAANFAIPGHKIYPYLGQFENT